MEKRKEKYRIADLNIEMETDEEKTYAQAESYMVKDEAEFCWQSDGTIEFPEGYLQKKREEEYPHLPADAVEYICTGSLFYRILLRYNGMMLHSSAVVVDGYAYLFSADSGTGKSTHTGLWKKYFGDRAFIINDDKPAIRKVDGEWYVYGTPWSGKTAMNVNTRAKLGAIVFLERSEENWISNISVAEAIPKFVAQTTRKLYKEENMDLLLANLNELFKDAPMYKMGCNISDEAVITAYKKIRRV